MKTLLITEAERLAICEAADILRRVFKGHEVTPQEVEEACQDLQAINYICPTWEDGRAS